MMSKNKKYLEAWEDAKVERAEVAQRHAEDKEAAFWDAPNYQAYLEEMKQQAEEDDNWFPEVICMDCDNWMTVEEAEYTMGVCSKCGSFNLKEQL